MCLFFQEKYILKNVELFSQILMKTNIGAIDR